MPTEPPPSRYKVIERGRRLEVIDTRLRDGQRRSGFSGRLSRNRAHHAAPSSNRLTIGRIVALALAGGATDEHGDPIVETRAFYDDEAPRLLVLNGAAQRKISVAVIAIPILAVAAAIIAVQFPASPILLIGLAFHPVQSWLRRRSTAWLDEVQAGADVASDG